MPLLILYLGHPLGNDPGYYLEESGNALIMAASHARGSRDNTQIAQYYDVLVGWSNYLVNDSYYPRQQGEQLSIYRLHWLIY